jgi:GTPase SAR1 family protein
MTSVQNGVHINGSTLGDTTYAVSRQKLNQIVNVLRDLGAQRVGVNLPRIAVIGNQSAGKSCLIEAISQIRLPRQAGTCTRCPMEVILSSAPSTWEAKIFLRRGMGQSKQEFASTTSREEITGLIRNAQLAVLNPEWEAVAFRNFTEEQRLEFTSARSFTNDTVVLEITGAEVDIAFVDLPGQIQNVRTFPYKP